MKIKVLIVALAGLFIISSCEENKKEDGDSQINKLAGTWGNYSEDYVLIWEFSKIKNQSGTFIYDWAHVISEQEIDPVAIMKGDFTVDSNNIVLTTNILGTTYNLLGSEDFDSLVWYTPADTMFDKYECTYLSMDFEIDSDTLKVKYDCNNDGSVDDEEYFIRLKYTINQETYSLQ